MAHMIDHAPRLNKRPPDPLSGPKVSVFRVTMLSLAVFLSFTIALIYSFKHLADHPNRPDASVISDMNMFSQYYRENGFPLTVNNQPFLIPAMDALSTMIEESGDDGADVEAQFEGWEGTRFYLVGQQERILVAHVNQATCQGVVDELGVPMLEESDPKKGLSRMISATQEFRLGCHRQLWEGSISPLYAALEFDTAPKNVATYMLYLALPNPSKNKQQI